MSDERENEYTIRGWWRDLRENGMARSAVEKPRPKSKWKPAFWCGVIGMVVGILKVFMFKNGLLEWLRITSMSYQEVSETPYLPIWTSGRGVVGVIFLSQD